MFRVVFVDRLTDEESRKAIAKPIEKLPDSERMDDDSVNLVVRESGGYPYFIQFICREVYDVFLRRIGEDVRISMTTVKRKLDTDFFSGRWARASDRQRDLLQVIARLPASDTEFTIQEIAETSQELLEKPFGSSQISNMLAALGEAGLIYKNRHGKYAFAVPMMGDFIRRQDL